MIRYIAATPFLLWASCLSPPAKAQVPWQMPKSDFGGARPIAREKWIGFQDYPTVSVMHREQGYVVVSFDITAKGKVENCTVVRSSGFPRLDAVPCRLLIRRARFEPGTSSDGTPIATKGQVSAPFWIP